MGPHCVVVCTCTIVIAENEKHFCKYLNPKTLGKDMDANNIGSLRNNIVACMYRDMGHYLCTYIYIYLYGN